MIVAACSIGHFGFSRESIFLLAVYLEVVELVRIVSSDAKRYDSAHTRTWLFCIRWNTGIENGDPQAPRRSNTKQTFTCTIICDNVDIK